MKKLFLFVAIVFAALALSSCSKDGASVSITNKNLVGTWAMVQTTTEEGETIDVTPTNYEYYEELVFAESSLTKYHWADNGDKYEWMTSFGEMEYKIKDNVIWAMGLKGPTIKKLTTKELLLDWGEGEISLYRKK